MKFKNMAIKIWIKDEEVIIQLLNREKLIDEINFNQARDMSEKLLPAIDRILRKNRISLKEIKRFYLVSDLAESFTSYRIVQATVNTFNYLISCG